MAARKKPAFPHSLTMVQKSHAALRAIHSNDPERLENLLKDGLPANMRIHKRLGTYHTIGKENPALFSLLVKYGVEVNRQGFYLDNPLFQSAIREDIRGMCRAISAGADPGETRGFTVGGTGSRHLLFYLSEKSAEVVQLALDTGGWTGLVEKDRKTGLTPVEALDAIAPEYAGPLANGMKSLAPDLLAERRRDTHKLYQRYAKMPRLDFSKGVFTKEELFRRNENGLCPLDHPETWKRLDEVVEGMIRGEKRVLTLEDLRQTNDEGVTWLQRAAECRAIPQLMRLLHRQNRSLGSEDLLREGRHPTVLYNVIRLHNQVVPYILGNDNCIGLWPGEVSALINALPPKDLEAHNIRPMALRMAAEQGQRSRNAGKIGR